MLQEPQAHDAILATKSAAQSAFKPALLGVRGRMVALAVIPVALAGIAILASVLSTIPPTINNLYETQTNQMVRVLMGNIDFTNPVEIEREFLQAMGSSTIIGMHLTQVDTDGQRRTQMVFRDPQAKTVFEAREPEYPQAVAQGAMAEREYFSNLNFQDSHEHNWVLRGTGYGGKYGATGISMLGLDNISALAIPQATATASGFALVVIDDQEVQGGQLRRTEILFFGSIIAALLLAVIGAIIVAQSLIRPIVKLTKLADAMSIGDLETPIEIKSRDELGKLGEALERTRLSLRLAIERTQRRRADRSSETTPPQ